jgi:hypothetical protein
MEKVPLSSLGMLNQCIALAILIEVKEALN